MRGFVAGTVILALVAFIASAAVAQNRTDAAKKELQTAFFHANELAQRVTTIAGVLQHVQHVVNCLEGPGGKNFKQAAGYPCQDQGKGIIPDLKAAEDADATEATRALRSVNVAYQLSLTVLKFTEVDAAQPWMKVIAQQLKQAIDALP